MRRVDTMRTSPTAVSLILLLSNVAVALEPIPDRLVVLTFDDAVKSHFTVVRPLLKQHGFGATFFVTEGFDFKTNKKDYMTWDEIARLHSDGFEIGNHTRDHLAIERTLVGAVNEQLTGINRRCEEHGIPKPVTFAWPGNKFHDEALPPLTELGIRFARRGGSPEYAYEKGRGFAYEPGLDHPLLIPSAGDARPNWTLEDFKRAVHQAELGRIAVITFHGVPDAAHPWVNTPEAQFRKYMQYLKDNDFTVIAMRDLAKYVDPQVAPRDAYGVIDDREQMIKSGRPYNEFRTPAGNDDLKRWLQNMVWHHRFTVPEIRMATGLSTDEVTAALERFDVSEATRPTGSPNAPLLVLPYPGGRHPRTGFLEGAIRPQRDTKLSIFLPWDEAQYVVLDVPEAIRRNNEREHGLLYLAHTHVPTMWTRRGVNLEPLEWTRHSDGTLAMERRLPNGVVFGTRVEPKSDALRMEMWLTNGSDETLSQLRVQNCIMLKGAPDFAAMSNDNKLLQEPYIAGSNRAGDRWVITAWTPCFRAWANPPCPCMHSDPQFPDCKPGETKRLRGWLSFYEGTDIKGELARIEATGWAGE